MILSPSKQHYIKTIYKLSPDNQGVHITEIANDLEITKASASTAMKSLQKDDYVYRSNNREVFLTEKGTSEAVQLCENHDTIRSFLINVLKIDQETAGEDACAIEHVISEASVGAMKEMMEE